MKRVSRLILGLGLAAALLSCNLLSFGSTQTPSASNTPGPTPTLTPSPIPSPTVTPVPIVRVGSGDKALFDGDVDTAMAEYRAALGDTTDQSIKASALWGLARAQYEDARYSDAITTLDQLITGFPNSPYLAAANFIKGQSFSAMQHDNEAAVAYQAYLKSRPGVLDSYVQELRGDALSGSGSYADALSAYMTAQAAPHLDDAQALQIKIAQTHAKIGDYASALSMYDSIATNTTNDYIRAQMDYLGGEAYIALNQKDQAYGRFEHAVENYWKQYYSYPGLIELVNANVKVNDLDRGLTDYYAGHYDVALTAFDRYLAANPENDGTAHYYRAYALENLQKYQEAVDEFTYFIQHYSTNPNWPDAWYEKSAIQWSDLNLYPDSAQTLLDYVKAAPTSSQAVDDLMSAARILERDGRFDQASQVWQQVSIEYPGNSQASTAVFFAGIMQYRQADYHAALPLFERSLVQAVVPEDQARAYLWIGKTHDKLGSAIDKQNAWQQAQNADPGGYYSVRASDLLMGHTPFAPPLSINLNLDLTAERKSADSWIRLTFNLPAETDLSGLGALASDPRIIRGKELWDLGEYEDAHLEFEDLRCELAIKDGFNCYTFDRIDTSNPSQQPTNSDDAISTYRLTNYLLDLGDYNSGIYTARQVLALAGLDDQTKSMLAPPYFSHVRYGLYYSDLILPAAQKNSLDPLFLFSVVRWESLFQGFVNSTKGARGLMQIIPSTGAGIARALGWPINYTPDQLYRPNVSIAFGSYYLASNRGSLDGDLYAALSAYNGGLGNALDWRQLSRGDPDLFLETVRFEETRNYIRNIYEIYTVYRRLYGSGS